MSDLTFGYGGSAQFAIEAVRDRVGDMKGFFREKGFAHMKKPELEGLALLAAGGFGCGSRHVITSYSNKYTIFLVKPPARICIGDA